MPINIKQITEKLYKKWLEHPLGLSAPLTTEQKKEIQQEASDIEDKILKVLNKLDEWNFCLTPNSRTPADIVGVRENNSTIYFFLIQVKSGTNSYINKTHKEEETLPLLKDILKSILSNEKRKIIITTCFILVEKGENNQEYSTVSINNIKNYCKNGKVTSATRKMQEGEINKVIPLIEKKLGIKK